MCLLLFLLLLLLGLLLVLLLFCEHFSFFSYIPSLMFPALLFSSSALVLSSCL